MKRGAISMTQLQTRLLRSVSVVITGVLAATIASGAEAQTTIGEVPPTVPNVGGCAPWPFVQAVTAHAPGYAVPAGDWLLTSWSHRARSGLGQSVKLKVFRPIGDPATTTSYGVVGEHGPAPLTPSALNTFTLASPIRVQGGDRLGMVSTAGSVECSFASLDFGDVERLDNGGSDPGVGTTMTTDSFQQGFRLNLSATLLQPQEGPTCMGKPATIVGTNGSDVRTGLQGQDVIAGLGGNDTLSGLGGKDVICAGAGKDTLKGGKGNDSLLGQKGKDSLKGGGGKDLCKGGKGKDTATGCEVEKSI